MLTIRREQMEVFKQGASRNFEDAMVQHINNLFLRLARRVGEPGLRDVIRYGIRKAHQYGIIRQCDIGRYIAIMLMFGPHFDEKATSGPLQAVLRDPRFRTSIARTNALCAAAAKGLRIRARRTGNKPQW